VLQWAGGAGGAGRRSWRRRSGGGAGEAAERSPQALIRMEVRLADGGGVEERVSE
jgi:hypothetical protein